MSMTPGTGPVSRGQDDSERLISRRIRPGRRDRRQGWRRAMPVQVLVQGANPSAKGVTFEISGVSRSFNRTARVRVAAMPVETNNLDSELDSIFQQLHNLDVSISQANYAIDELRESTRSIIRDLLAEG